MKNVLKYGIVLAVVCALLGSCFSPYKDGEDGLGAIVIGLPDARSVVTDAEAGSLSYTVTLTGPGDTITRTISSMGLSVKVIPGDWVVEIKAYGKENGGISGLDTFLRAVNRPVTVTVRPGENTPAIINMVTATEIDVTTSTAWVDLQTAATGTTATGREEIIYLKGNGTHSFTGAAQTISIQRNVTIIAEGSWTITRAGLNAPLFSVGPNGNLTLSGTGLELNGMGLAGNSGSLVTVSIASGSFTLDGPTLKNNYTTASGGGVYLANGSSFTMKRGTISDNHAISGGGVYHDGSGSFTMSGGTISGNQATSTIGGGVYVSVNSSFTMSGGTISGNDAASQGGGVFFAGGGGTTFTMSGGTIGGTYPSNSAAQSGGGVYFASGTFNMSGGARILGNKTVGTGTGSGGGGVFVNGGAFTVEGSAEITDNETTGSNISGGGLYVYSGEFTLKGNARISSNDATGSGGGVYFGGTTFNMSGSASISDNEAAYDGGGVYFGSSTTFTMEGGTIGGTYPSNSAGHGGGVYFGGATFDMYGSAIISGNQATDSSTGDGGAVYINSGSFDMYGNAIISRNTAAHSGGGVSLSGSSGTFTLSGNAIISRNTATSTGGGVYVNSSGTFLKTGGGTLYGIDDPANSNTANSGSYGYGQAAYRILPPMSHDTTLDPGEDTDSTDPSDPNWGS
ncbi:MAG: hypothetical protein LBT39_10515 [Treponema sp.]|jgi:hypothetical protein|nr:hypothetical protein [Treponema sp.]